MLIRISGGVDGIQAYLEDGQKQGRELSRDQLDERVILAGDLDHTTNVIRSMEGDAERYLHITLAFKEDKISVDTLREIAQAFEAFAFAAYESDEYCFYAEAHLPKIKSYQSQSSGDFVERKPHIHIVIPKLNLLSGTHLNPFGVVDQNTRFLDAFQEHINYKYGLASPKDNRRIEFTGASEMISRYKGDIFEGQSKDLKAQLLDQILASKITTVDAFKTLLAKHGVTVSRRAGQGGEYQNIKVAGQAKGVNLKEYVFSREFIELSDVQKHERLSADVTRKYEIASQQRRSPAQITSALQEWGATRAMEVKYINSGNRKAYQAWRAANPQERQRILAMRRDHFYSKHRKEVSYDITHGRRFDAYAREFGFKPTSQNPSGRPERTNADWQPHLEPGRREAPAQSIDSVRNLSRVGVDGFNQGGEVLLPNHAPDHLEHGRAKRPDALRWHRAGGAAVGQEFGFKGADRPWGGQPGVQMGQGAGPPKTLGRVRNLTDVATLRIGREPVERGADNLVAQISKDLRKGVSERYRDQLGEFHEIKQTLDAKRLLAAVARSHGVIPEKYQVSKGKDGSHRIQCGTRNLNVSDFLTRELNLPWKEAAIALRQCYAEQIGQTGPAPARVAPRRQLWLEFKSWSKTQTPVSLRQLWQAQRAGEISRRGVILQAYYKQRGATIGNRALKGAQRKAALSVARMARLVQQEALRAQIKQERAAINARALRPVQDLYCDFLVPKAQGGDEQALAELRRMRSQAEAADQVFVGQITAVRLRADTERDPIAHLAGITYQVHHNGDVTYQRGGRDMLHDNAGAVKLVQTDTLTIKTGLRLAQQKFSGALVLVGDVALQETIAATAGEAGLDIKFDDRRLQEIADQKRAEVAVARAREFQGWGKTKAVPAKQVGKPVDAGGQQTGNPGKDTPPER